MPWRGHGRCHGIVHRQLHCIVHSRRRRIVHGRQRGRCHGIVHGRIHAIVQRLRHGIVHGPVHGIVHGGCRWCRSWTTPWTTQHGRCHCVERAKGAHGVFNGRASREHPWIRPWYTKDGAMVQPKTMECARIQGRCLVQSMDDSLSMAWSKASFMDGHGFARGQRHGVGCPLHRSETMPWMMACRGSYGINNTSFERVKDTNIWHKCKKTPQKQISGNHLIHSRRKKEFESAHHAQHTRHGSRQNLDERVRTAFSCRPHYLP